MTDLPKEIHAWRQDPADGNGTWAVERYPEEAHAYVRKDPPQPRARAEGLMTIDIEQLRADVATHDNVKADWIAALVAYQKLPNRLHLARAVLELRDRSKALALDVLASSGQAQDAYDAQKKAEAERDALHEQNRKLREAVRRATDSIDHLNTLRPDQNGHRWRESDLIDQEVMSLRAALAEGESDD